MIEDDDMIPSGGDLLRGAALQNTYAAQAARFLSMAALAGVDIERPLADMALDAPAVRA